MTTLFSRADPRLLSNEVPMFKKSKKKICRACEGSGVSSSGKECFPCKGEGKITPKKYRKEEKKTDAGLEKKTVHSTVSKHSKTSSRSKSKKRTRR